MMSRHIPDCGEVLVSGAFSLFLSDGYDALIFIRRRMQAANGGSNPHVNDRLERLKSGIAGRSMVF
jgi:hypothetical protein